jgi:hypothetical protein
MALSYSTIRDIAAVVADDCFALERHRASGAFEAFGPVHRVLQRQELLRRLAVERSVKRHISVVV